MATASTVNCSLMFLSGLRGYHEYRAVWTPQLNEVLPTIHERTNPHDCYAIAARKRLTGCIGESTVGHLPKEISRVTRFIMLYGAVVTVKVLDTHHRRSPLVQGGLEMWKECTLHSLHMRIRPPRGAGGMPESSNLPSKLLSLVIALSPSYT